jgi:hypothetical protein
VSFSFRYVKADFILVSKKVHEEERKARSPRIGEEEACEKPSMTCYMKQTEERNILVCRLSIGTP